MRRSAVDGRQIREGVLLQRLALHFTPHLCAVWRELYPCCARLGHCFIPSAALSSFRLEVVELLCDEGSTDLRLKQDIVLAHRGCYFNRRWMEVLFLLGSPQMSLFTSFFLCPGISTLIAKGVYDAAFPLHDVSVRFESPCCNLRKKLPEMGKSVALCRAHFFL